MKNQENQIETTTIEIVKSNYNQKLIKLVSGLYIVENKDNAVAVLTDGNETIFLSNKRELKTNTRLIKNEKNEVFYSYLDGKKIAFLGDLKDIKFIS